jgi:hypothetical protein
MKKYVAATSKPQAEWDHKVKREFDSCLKEATEEISQELGKVATVSDSEKQRMSQLVKKAAKLWLEVGQQRCRMSLLMSESSEDPVRSRRTALDRDGSLSLVVVPELRRRGNAQGERLDTDDLVMDCKGKLSVFYAS